MVDPVKIKSKYPLDLLQGEVDSLNSKMTNAHKTGINISELSAELSYKSSLLNEYKSLHLLLDDLQQHNSIIGASSDKEFVEMAKEELPELETKTQEAIERIIEMEIEHELADSNDSRSAIIEIRAGAGGEEASLFASDLYRMYASFAASMDWDVEMINASTSEKGGFKEVVALIKGKNVYQKLKYESGVHRVQRIPTTESSGRIHTSTVSVAILPEAQDIDIELRTEDLQVETMRATGAGGQKTNKTSSAVRITHLPSGIVVSCQETKIQQQNKEKAMQILRARLYDMKREAETKKRDSLRNSQIGSAMRAEKIRTYNFPQSRITDHRIKVSWHNLEEVLGGNLEDLVNEVDDKIKKSQLEKIRKQNSEN